MRKNVWKRFLAMALAAVVMFTSVDCTGLVANAEGTTKTLGEMVTAHNESLLSAREVGVITHPDLKYNETVYDFTTPESGLKSVVDIDISTQTVGVREPYNDERTGITWLPIGGEVKFKDASVPSEEFEFSADSYVYQYTTGVQTAEVDCVDVIFRPVVHMEPAEQAEILNAVYYLYYGSDTAGVFAEALASDASTIESSVDYLSQAVGLYEILSADETTLSMLELAGIALPEISIEALSADVNTLKTLNAGEGFKLGTIANAVLEAEDVVLAWKEYAQDMSNNITESEEPITALAAENGDLMKLGQFLQTVGITLQNEDASKLGNKITGDYFAAYNSYLESLVEEEIDVDDLYVDKTAIVTGIAGGMEFPKAKDIKLYDEADILNAYMFSSDLIGSVEVPATQTVVTVNVSAKVIDNNAEKALGPKTFDIPIEKGSTVSDVKAAAADTIKEKLADMDTEGKYNLNDYSDVYAPTYYECKVEPENLTIEEKTSISVTYSPKNYVVTYKEDGKADVTESVPYLSEITLPGSEVENQSYEYTLVSAPEMDDKVRDEGAAYLIKGNVTFKRTLGKSKDVYKVNDIVLDAYTELKGTDAEDILKHSAVKSDTVAVRKPDNSLISATVEGKTTIVNLPSFEANSEFTWVPNRIFVKNKGITVATIGADQIIDGVARIAYPKRDSIEVEYALEIASGEKADEYVNLAYDLATSVNEHISDMEKLVGYQADLKILTGFLLKTLSEGVSVEYQEVKEALANIANYGCDPANDGPLIISNYIKDYVKCENDLERVQFYFNSYYCEEEGKEYKGLRAQIELLADNLAVIAKDENKPALDALAAKIPMEGIGEKIGLLTTYATAIGELKASHFKPMHKNIIADSEKYNDLIDLLVSSSVDEITGVTSLCMTENLTISGDDLPAAAKEQTVNVKVEWTKNGEVLSKEAPVVFYDVDSTEEVVVLLDEKAAALAAELAVDTLHYECTEPTLDANPANGSTVTYKWDAKTYTVTVVDEQGAQVGTAQTFTYELPKFDLERPDADHVYTYVIGTEEVTVIAETDVLTYTLSNTEFKAMFDDANTTSAQITRKVSEVEWDDAWITVNVVIEGSNGVTNQAGSSSVKFKVNGLGAEGVEAVKAAAASIANAHVDTAHYTCTEPSSSELNENITANTTVTYTWKPNEYGVELWGEGDADHYSLQKFYYDNPVILLDRPSKGYVHTFDINGSVIVKFAEGTYSEEYRFSEETFKALFDDKDLETIKINRVVSEQVINVTVQVKWQGNVAEKTVVHGDYTEAGILDLVAQMADDLEVDKVHYVYEKPNFVSNPEDDVTYVFEYKAKEFTVNLADETNKTYKTQKITYEDPTFYLVYPTSEELIYTYTVLGNEYPLKYTGEEVFDFYLGEELFDTFFAGEDSVTIKRTETEKEAQINVVVKVLDDQGSEFDAREVRVYIPVSKLGAEGIETVKATAADLAGRYFKLNYLTAVEPELGERLTDGEVVTFVWNPTKYTVKIAGERNEELAEQVISLYSRLIKLSRPANDDKCAYSYRVGNSDVTVKAEGESVYEYSVSDKDFYTLVDGNARISREEIPVDLDYADVENNKETLEDAKVMVEKLVEVTNGDKVETLVFNQSTTDAKEGALKGNPEAMVVKIEDNDSQDGGITTAVAATVVGLVVGHTSGNVEFISQDENGNTVKHVVKDSKNGISIQALIDALLYSGIGTAHMDGMYDSDGNPKNTVNLPEGAVQAGEENETVLFGLFGRRASANLGAEVLTLNVVLDNGEGKKSTTFELIFSFTDEDVTDENKEFRASLKGLRNIAEVTGKDGRLTVDVKSKEVFETYLMMMLLEGETDFANINNVELTEIVKSEYGRFITDLQGQNITVQTLQNTMKKFGKDFNLNENSTIRNVITELINAAEQDGYKDSKTSALKFYMDEVANENADAESTYFHAETKTEKLLDKASALGVDAEMIKGMIIEEEMNVIDDVAGSGYLDIPVKLNVAGLDDDNAAMVINDPNELKKISTDDLGGSAEIAANAIELVEEDYFEGKILNNSMIVLLKDMKDTTINFPKNGILDLNGHSVKEVVGKDGGSTVVLVDSTYGNRGSAVAGTNVKDARLFGGGVKDAFALYTVSQDDAGNLTVALDGNALAEAAVAGTTELKVLAVEIALDLMMNNITSGDMVIEGTNNRYDIYELDIVDDIFVLMDDLQNNQTDLINQVIDIVRLGEKDANPKNLETYDLFGFVNDVLAELTKVDDETNAFKTMKNTVKDGENDTIVSYTVDTNPVKVNFAVAGERTEDKDSTYITAGIKTGEEGAASVKTVTVDFKIADNDNEQKLANLCRELESVVKKSDVNVDLDNIEFANKGIEATGASVNTTLHVDLLRGTAKTNERGKSEAPGNHDYAAIIALIAAYGNNGALSKELVEGVKDYLKDGSIDMLKEKVEKITVKQLISAVKNANGKTFDQIIDGVDGVTDSVKDLEAVYDDLFRVVYRLATILSNKLGIEGDNSKLGSLAQKPVEVKDGDVTFTYYSYGGDYEGSRQISKGFFGIGAKAEGSLYADLSLTLFATDDGDWSEPGGNEPGGNEPGGNEPGGNEPGGNEPGGNEPGGNTPGGNTPGGSGSSSDNKKPVEVHPAPSKPSTPAATTGTKTGDANNMVLWISVMGIAAIAVVATVAMKKRKTK